MTLFQKFRDSVDFTGGFFRRITGTGVNLTKKNELDAGLDLYSRERCVILPTCRAVIGTGIQVEILPGYVGLIKARSGMAVMHGILVGAGVVDAPYRGEIKVLLFNLGDKPYSVEPGDRIAQLLTVPVNLGAYENVEYLSGTERGDNGFGSSGR